MVSTFDLIAGILTLLPLVIGYTMGVITLRIYLQKSRSTLVLLTAILFFALPSPWLGVSTVFVEQLLGLKVLNDTTYVFLYAWSIPIIATIWLYTSASLLKFSDKIKWVVLVITLVVDALFLYSIYVQKDFEVNKVPDSIFYDSTFTGNASLISTLMVVSIIVIVVPLYFWIAYRTDDKLFTFKARFIGLGALLFSIAAGLDANLELSTVGIIAFVRFFLVISLICLYLGYNTPNSIRQRYQ